MMNAVCNGDGFDEDQDGICDDVDSCIGEYDDCGICNGDGECPPFYNLTIDYTGINQLIILSNENSVVSEGGQIGVFDSNGLIANAGECNGTLDNILVASFAYNGENEMEINAIGSVDNCAFGGSQLSGYMQGNPVIIKYFNPQQYEECSLIIDWSAGTGYFGDLLMNGSIVSTENCIQIGAPQPAPQITSIVDIPNDQGGRVYLSFMRSIFDLDSLNNRNELYSVERLDSDSWVTVQSGGAYGQNEYLYEVPTLYNMTDEQDGTTSFRVVATMDEGNWVSEIVDGYSTDDLAPATPDNFSYQFVTDYNIVLSWSAVDDDDFSHYYIHRNWDNSYMKEYIVTTDLNLVLSNQEVGLYYYSISSVDHNGNVSIPSEIEFEVFEQLSLEKPLHFSLKGCYPNPFNPTTTIGYDVSSISNVNISIYNANGQLVDVLTDKMHKPGEYSIVWNAQAYTSGVYFVKLVAGEFVKTQKMMLIR